MIEEEEEGEVEEEATEGGEATEDEAGEGEDGEVGEAVDGAAKSGKTDPRRNRSSPKLGSSQMDSKPSELSLLSALSFQAIR